MLRGVVSARRGAEGAVFSVDFTRIVMTVSQVNNNIALIKIKNEEQLDVCDACAPALCS